MEQYPCWEADSHSASQEIARLLWNWKVQYGVHEIPPLVRPEPDISIPHPRTLSGRSIL